MESLIQYIESRVEQTRKTLGLSSLSFTQDLVDIPSATIPICFNESRLASLIGSPETHLEPHSRSLIALAAQLGALLSQSSPPHAIKLDRLIEKLHDENNQYDWTGVYVLKGTVLRLAAFRGEPSPHEIIPASNGICGAAVQENKTLNIPDVRSDPRYLSCDYRTKSEIVVPIRNSEGIPIGEIDIDSHLANAFSETDGNQLEELALALAPIVVHLT